jgi:hypothetical protein
MKTSDQMRRVSGIVSLNIGDIKVSFVPDGAIKVRARGLFPGSNEGDWAANPRIRRSARMPDCGPRRPARRAR